jgi:hypothetical protein
MPKDKKEKKSKTADADLSVVADDAEMDVEANGQVCILFRLATPRRHLT